MSKDTVTLPRAEYEALLKQKEMIERLRDELEDIQDAAFMQQLERDREAGVDTGETFPAELVNRLLDSGEHPLRVWREYRGLTMQELEKKSGVKQSYISEIETRKKAGSVATLKALADALGLTVDDLIPN
jgi:ribosome-binding protein aMBF1 (putative translation factor)